MYNRIKALRKHLGLTQAAFGQRIGLKKSSVSQIESGTNNLSNGNIISICREFHVNETWLRTGEGEMFTDSPLKEQIKAWVDGILVDQSEAYKLRLAAALAELDEAGWEVIYNLAVKLVGEVKAGNAPEVIRPEEDQDEDEEERLEREAEMVKQSYIESHRKGGRSKASSGGGGSTA